MKTRTMQRPRQSRRGLVSHGLVQRGFSLPAGKRPGKSRPRGFAAMDSTMQRQIASLGGWAVSRNRKHMAAIGRIGGQHSHQG